jgi:hypothetical protein
MKERLNPRRSAALLACVATLGATAVAATPAAGAPAAHSCGSRTIAVSAKGGKSVTFPVSRIRVEGGATCQEAIAVIRGFVLKKLPKGWAVGPGAFKVPPGLRAQIATNGHKKVKFALVGPES